MTPTFVHSRIFSRNPNFICAYFNINIFHAFTKVMHFECHFKFTVKCLEDFECHCCYKENNTIRMNQWVQIHVNTKMLFMDCERVNGKLKTNFHIYAFFLWKHISASKIVLNKARQHKFGRMTFDGVAAIFFFSHFNFKFYQLCPQFFVTTCFFFLYLFKFVVIFHLAVRK